jgi:hypothetical protein
MDVQSLDLDLLQPRADARLVSQANVDDLKTSIKELGGLLNPVLVRNRGPYYEVIAGGHRVAAYRQLWQEAEPADRPRWKHIPCHLADDDKVCADEASDDRAEMAMIDENLCRAGLGLVDTIVQLGRRKELHERLHPDSKAGRVRARAANASMGHNVTDTVAPTFSEEFARKLDKSERTLQRMTRLCEKIEPQALEKVKGSQFENMRFLQELASIPRPHQLSYATALRQSKKMVDSIAGAVGKRWNATEAASADGSKARVFSSEEQERLDDVYSDLGTYVPPPSSNRIIQAYREAPPQERAEFFDQLGYELPWPSTSAP